MPKRRNKEQAESEEEEAVSAQLTAQDDSEEEDEKAKPKKKVKASEGSQAKGVKAKIDLGKAKFVDVREFKGVTLIDIREYYEDRQTGEMKPGKKGISLQKAQWETLKDNMDAINDKIEKLEGS